MKKTLWLLLCLLAVALIWGIAKYNSFVKTQEKMTQAWSQVENVYQRRMDLIPNLVSVVKAYSNYESTTLIEVVKNRAMQAAAIKVDPENMTEEQLLEFENSQQLLDNAVNDVIVSVENYPDLKAVETYQTFLAQYEGSENRILVERRRYNEMVQDYNKSIRSFPSSLIADWFGFETHPYFGR
ncbi:MAG: LemA family protein [Bacteroidales bacterium]|nr:LemA family protein [Bacteroidales bacterium]MBR4147540.1 LemA family protein [Bacteroidales bacterium]